MWKPVFKLEQVLKFRKEVEKVRNVEFAVAKHEYELAQDRLRNEEECMDRLCTEFMDKQLAGICATDLLLYSDFFTKKRKDIKEQRHDVARLDEDVTVKREFLLEAVVDKKVLEGLKEKKLKAHKQNLQEKERAFLDELALRKGENEKK